MTRRRPLFVVLTTLCFILLAGIVVAQVVAPATCPEAVLQALRTVNTLCQGQGRNSACYGNYLVEAQLAAGQPADLFDAPADVAALNLITALRTAPLNADLSEWGVSLLSVQANIPGALPGQNALFMLLGGAEIESAIPEDRLFTGADQPITLQATAEAALLERPAQGEPVTHSVQPGDALLADARSGDYLRVTAGDQFGWIRRDQTNADAARTDGLPEFTQGASFTPMQSFYLRTGIGEPRCGQAPSALVIQGPQGMHVNIEANGADITLGSTILLRSYSVEEAQQSGLPIIGSAETGGLLELSVIDGRAIVRQKNGSIVIIEEGTQSFICLDNPANLGADGQANDQAVTDACGGWTPPEPIPQSVRDEFALVDDYPLIYPVDVMTPAPASRPPQSAPSATPAEATATLTVTPTGTLTVTPSGTPSGTTSSTPTVTPSVTPSNTPTNTPSLPPTATGTPLPPTATNTPLPPTATNTPEPPGFRVTICHNNTDTLNVTLRELLNHFFADGRPQFGEHRNDYFGPCR